MRNKKKIGEIIKNIRTNKGISAKVVYEGIMDKANFWRFENGYIESSFSNVLQIMERLNVFFDEFAFLLNEEDIKEEYELIFEYWSKSNIFVLV